MFICLPALPLLFPLFIWFVLIPLFISQFFVHFLRNSIATLGLLLLSAFIHLKITNSKDRNAWKPDSRRAGQEISRLLWNLKSHCNVPKNPHWKSWIRFTFSKAVYFGYILTLLSHLLLDLPINHLHQVSRLNFSINLSPSMLIPLLESIILQHVTHLNTSTIQYMICFVRWLENSE
jgi:hypothetical protein